MRSLEELTKNELKKELERLNGLQADYEMLLDENYQEIDQLKGIMKSANYRNNMALQCNVREELQRAYKVKAQFLNKIEEIHNCITRISSILMEKEFKE